MNLTQFHVINPHLGIGGVGKAVLSQLLHLRKSYPQIQLALLASTRFTHYLAAQESSLFQIIDPSIPEAEKTTFATEENPAWSPSAILTYLKTLPSKTILIDNTSSPAVVAIYAAALSAGISIVTPNKKAFSAPLQTWQPIANAAFPTNPTGGFLYHESTVGAGLPIISTLRDLLATGDKIESIEGVFSGTMSFLFNNFDPAGASPSSGPGAFSAEVTNAQRLGYTEPDPRDDLDGGDVARKLVILARLCGLDVEGIDAFPVESLIPEALRGEDMVTEVFLKRLREGDGEMGERRRRAGEKGRVLRYTGRIGVGTGEVRVGVGEFEKGTAIAGLKGADNVVAFTTERYKERPLVVQGAG